MDVIIIGDGPTGCSAAITCSKGGLKTAIISRKRINKEHFFIESVGALVVDVLSDLGTIESLHSSSLSKYTFIKPSQSNISLPDNLVSDSSGFHISKTAFKQGLLNSTLNKGVEIIYYEGKIIVNQLHYDYCEILFEDNKVIRARYIIDATGKEAALGKMLKFKQKKFSPNLISWSGQVCNIDNETWAKLSTCFIPTNNGWTWLAPNLPNCCAWTRLAIKGKNNLVPPIELQQFSNIDKIRAEDVTWRLFRPLVAKGIILAGDAAGILDPATGQGILYGLWSGKIAAETVINILNDFNSETMLLETYDDWFVNQYQVRYKQLKLHYQNLGIIF